MAPEADWRWLAARGLDEGGFVALVGGGAPAGEEDAEEIAHAADVLGGGVATDSRADRGEAGVRRGGGVGVATEMLGLADRVGEEGDRHRALVVRHGRTAEAGNVRD